MNSLWSRASTKSEPQGPSAATDATEPGVPPPAEVGDVTDVADIGVTVESSLPPEMVPLPAPDPPPAPARPQLLRNQTPTPPSDPDPLASGSEESQPQQPQATDSLSLQQLRDIVANFKRGDAVAYDFAYGDMSPLAEEIDEWFSHQDRQWYLLHLAQLGFEDKWPKETPWEDADVATKEEFLGKAVEAVQSQDMGRKEASIGSILYVVLGVWVENASAQKNATATKTSRDVATKWQLGAIQNGVDLIAKVGGIQVVWKALVDIFERFWSEELQAKSPSELQSMDDELNTLMTIVYITLQVVLSTDSPDLRVARDVLLSMSPSMDSFMLNATSMLRWEENETMPATRFYLLLWKSLLLVFGNAERISQAKAATSEVGAQGKHKDMISASPIDYHVFRQEIISKYPAYIPPKPAIPLEADNCSLLPPLPNQPSRTSGGGVIPLPPNLQAGGASILHQPVHIATPAPSPPPSPGIGKGAKKQNYQTNQNFPFMYPPLDATSNSAGGKGGAGLQELLVGRRWEGSDVPASILEAGKLFSERVRMTRATRQLWEERERFLKFERGWEAGEDDDIEDLCLDELTPEEREEIRALKLNSRDDETKEAEKVVDYGPQENLDPDIKRRLDAVEHFYHEALPQLQSLVIVLLKVILANIVMLSQGHHPGAAPRQNGPGMNGAPNGPTNKAQDKNGGQNGQAEHVEMTPVELSSYRTKEIGAKAVAGILLLLLKWFKISHVLKFEYLTQLLVDSNYLPLVLKLLAHADVPQLVGTKIDRIETSFFYFCNAASRNTRPLPAESPVWSEDKQGPAPSSSAVSSDDDAVPPPVKRRKSPQTIKVPQAGSEFESGQTTARPEVDELGYPVNEIPKEPITDFSKRNFFTLINYLRVMQKCCKNKAHRNLLLVSYKSANILRKSLKVPQQDLRLYTLKLFKNQVPYCGRKWRQSNMRVITAVYLHCRPELRDEWLAGSDVDAEVEAALPLEQALRSLTHWFNVRRYPEKVQPKVKIAMKEEQDFFTRELEKIHLSWPDGLDDSESSEWDHDGTGWP